MRPTVAVPGTLRVALGLELHFELDPEGHIASMELLDNRDSAEPIVFSPEEFEEGRQKYERYMQKHGRRNIKKRRQIGMVIQTGPNLPHHIHPEDVETS